MKLGIFSLLSLVSVIYGCPSGFDYISGKCYKLGVALNQNDANLTCTGIDEGDHLWIIDSQEEFSHVIEFYFPSSHLRDGAIPAFWTDGFLFNNSQPIWATNGKPITYAPSQGLSNQCCLGDGCSGGSFTSGDCIAVGDYTSASVNGYEGYLSCDCASVNIPYMCESTDTTGTFTCPDDGLYESAPCSELFYNCFGGEAFPMYCEPGYVFEEELGYCVPRENDPNCANLTTTMAPTVMASTTMLVTLVDTTTNNMDNTTGAVGSTMANP